jgi:adenylate cyclase
LGLAVLLSIPAVVPVRMLDNVMYDSLYRLRPVEDAKDGPVVIVAVDDASIEAVDRLRKFGWPWPREFYGHMTRYLDGAGARAVVFDLLFDRSSVHNNASDDDAQFAAAIDAARTPTVFASIARPDGTLWDFAPPVKRPVLGATNVSPDDVIRTYATQVRGHPSVALATIRRIGAKPPDWAGEPFRLRYYGPHARDNKPATFRYVPAGALLAAALDPKSGAAVGITPQTFKDKVVLIGTITAATYDLKSTPLSARYPGVEVHATAIQNLLTGQRVTPVGAFARFAVTLVACLVAAVGMILPARVPLKVVGAACGILVVVVTATALFLSGDVRWFPPAAPLLATVAAAFGALAFSYFTELRQRRFILKALEQYVSREVAAEITRSPEKLSIHGERRDMTVMFTDLANFTTLSEALPAERLKQMLDFYLEEMSGLILANNGTLDKYIGDSIMSFWNAPVDQTDHARRACRAALQMRSRERVLAGQLLELAGGPVYSRIGINSGAMIVGNIGSSHKFNYTVLGDAVNVASRLEGANKLYGTQIILSETTAGIVADAFTLRKLDLLRVMGKTQPMGVYELICEGAAPDETRELIRRYEDALQKYAAGEFAEAEDMLVSLRGDFPGDGPTATLLNRVRQLRQRPPAQWDGVFMAEEK